MRRHPLLYIFCLLLSYALAGCAAKLKPGETDSNVKVPELATLMTQAGATEKSDTKSAAIIQYEEAAKLYPTSKMPWVRIAQIQYESLNYGEAIVAAQQAVARDGKDKVAQSILSVSGLRVSTKALAELGRQNELEGSVKTEAQNLAKLIRESLGEQVLVPVISPAASRLSSPKIRTPPAAVRAGTTPSVAPVTPERRGANPFDVLK